MNIKIKETYIKGNSVIFLGEDDREYTLGCDYTGIGGSLQECELIVYTRE